MIFPLFRFLNLSLIIKIFLILLSACLLTGLFLFFLLFIYAFPPADFPLNQIITIDEGATLKEVAADFEEKKVIRSAFWFETIGWLMRSEKKVKIGEYFFEEKENAIKLMKLITDDSYLNSFIKITIPEGYSLRDMANFFEKKNMWQSEELWRITGLPANENSMEGYLFPDTYYIPSNISSESMVKLMSDNFEKKVISGMADDISKSGRSFKEIITMASILEKEAAKKEDRKLIAGLLWKRLDKGMLLQVDAVFPYIMGKYSLQLTMDDLKIDTPYNTYLYKGLPPGPIANPGADAIEAAIYPTESEYWFYLSDKKGNLYFSETYDEHLLKKELYLN